MLSFEKLLSVLQFELGPSFYWLDKPWMCDEGYGPRIYCYYMQCIIMIVVSRIILIHDNCCIIRVIMALNMIFNHNVWCVLHVHRELGCWQDRHTQTSIPSSPLSRALVWTSDKKKIAWRLSTAMTSWYLNIYSRLNSFRCCFSSVCDIAYYLRNCIKCVIHQTLLMNSIFITNWKASGGILLHYMKHNFTKKGAQTFDSLW